MTKGQGTGKICSLYRGFLISRFFSIYFAITGVEKIVHYTEDFVISRFHCTGIEKDNLLKPSSYSSSPNMQKSREQRLETRHKCVWGFRHEPAILF